MSRRISRRVFLGGGLALLGIGGGVLAWSRRGHHAARIRDYLSYLRLDEAGVRDFVRDFVRAYSRRKLERTSDSSLAMQYLLSSDFFHSEGGEERNVRYSRLADPYVNPCYNPLARYR